MTIFLCRQLKLIDKNVAHTFDLFRVLLSLHSSCLINDLSLLSIKVSPMYSQSTLSKIFCTLYHLWKSIDG